MALPPSRPGLHSRSYTSGLCVCGGLMMMGASGVGRSPPLSDGTSSSVRKLSWPSSLCMGWRDDGALGGESGGGSVAEETGPRLRRDKQQVQGKHYSRWMLRFSMRVGFGPSHRNKS